MNTEIKQNIIDNFLNKGYRFSCVNIKKIVIGRIQEQSWFLTKYNTDMDILSFIIGNDIIDIKCIWETREDKNGPKYYLQRFE